MNMAPLLWHDSFPFNLSSHDKPLSNYCYGPLPPSTLTLAFHPLHTLLWVMQHSTGPLNTAMAQKTQIWTTYYNNLHTTMPWPPNHSYGPNNFTMIHKQLVWRGGHTLCCDINSTYV